MNVESDAVSAIIADIVDIYPKELAAGLRHPPGRRPTEKSRETQRIIQKLDASESEILVRTVVDATVFAVLSLIDANFKSKIAIRFERTDIGSIAPLLLHEKYRELVNPGGLRSDNEPA